MELGRRSNFAIIFLFDPKQNKKEEEEETRMKMTTNEKQNNANDKK